MIETTKILLEHLDLLAEHVRYQGEAARDGVPAGAAHLENLATRITSTVAAIRSAERDEDQARVRRAEVFTATPAGRNRDLVAAHARTASLVGRMQFCSVYRFDDNSASLGSIARGDDGSAMGLIEWFYALSGPKAVRRYVYDDECFAILIVEGRHEGRHFDVRATFRDAADLALIKECTEPSVHLLRRLQIAGAR